MMKEYYAKSPNGLKKQITVKEHLTAVSQQAKTYGKEVCLEQEAEIAGLFHDFGKYGQRFDGVLKGLRHNIDHAFSSAAYVYELVRRSRAQSMAYHPVITAINGHHDGLVDCGLIDTRLKASVASEKEMEANAGKTASLAGADYKIAEQAFRHDFPQWRSQPLTDPRLDKLRTMLRTRMLFSCLVDADYTMSAMHEDEQYIQRTEVKDFDPAITLDHLYRFCENIRSRSTADPALNQLRSDVFDQCGLMGDGDEGLYTLTSPTGTGKTLAMLHFALRQCLHTGKQRIIVVLPFLTLTEQNAKVYEEIVGTVLEDHSQSRFTDETREFTSRWRVPFIITTSVKFFETLFASQPGDCRKLHNIANSVILFDEAQTLPDELLSATLEAVKELCERYHCTMVFSTATQPAFRAITDWRPTEILPDHARLFAQLKRTQVEWRLDIRTPLSTIAEEMASQTNACVIVNLRAHARALIQALLSERGSSEGLFFLTTDLCPAHRKEVVSEVKARQKAGQPCLVVATQCIEAGIDLDFDVLYRSLAPLDSIIQAAGRCNRNGRPVLGRVIVFEPDEDHLYPSHDYEKAANTVKRLYDAKPIDIHDPMDIQRYYTKLYQDHADKGALQEAIEKLDYQEVNQQYKLINTQGYKVIVSYEGMGNLFEKIRNAASQGLTPALLREAAPIIVNVFQNNMEKLETMAERLYYPAKRGMPPQLSDTLILRPQSRERYDALTGLMLEETRQTNFNDFFY